MISISCAVRPAIAFALVPDTQKPQEMESGWKVAGGWEMVAGEWVGGRAEGWESGIARLGHGFGTRRRTFEWYWHALWPAGPSAAAAT